MFVLKSKYDALLKRCQKLEGERDYAIKKSISFSRQLDGLIIKWDELVARINAKGGEAFLNSNPKQLSAREIKKLLMLVHPDKHGASKLSEEMTILLLSLRK